MIFTPTIKDIIECRIDAYFNNKEYSSTTLYKYYDSLITGIKGKRCLYNSKGNTKSVNGVLIRTTSNNFKIPINSLNNGQLFPYLEADIVFVFTDDYGDRNICHWMTEQLLVLNYLIDLLTYLHNKKNDVEDNHSPVSPLDIKVVINRHPRHSMYRIIRDYLSKIPYLDNTSIIEMDFEDGSLYQEDILLEYKGLKTKHCFVGHAIKNTLHTIYNGWNTLHQRLVLYDSNQLELYSKQNTQQCNHFYMSRRNLLDPTKKTNTRVLDNLDEISYIITGKGYTEIFTDELKTLEERIYLFKKAKSIVCELGAGMHNLLYCSDGITIYVMFQKNNYSWLQEYFPLFKQKHLTVVFLSGETTCSEHNGNWLNTPWTLNLNELDVLPSVSNNDA